MSDKNGSAFNKDNMWKAISLLIVITGPLLLFYTQTQSDIAVIKEDLKFYKEIYNKEMETIKNRLSEIAKKENHIEKLLQEVISDLKVIKYELKIADRRR